MGFRIVEFEFESPPSADEEDFLRQVAAFADFHGAGGTLRPPEDHPGHWELALDANMSFLDHITPYLVESVTQIANDVDPDSNSLRALASYIGSQLTDQIMFRSEDSGISPARPGLELLARVEGEASYSLLEVELDLHERRVREELAEYHSLTGPTAWRRRHDLRLILRADALALAGAARRLQRIGCDLEKRIPSQHLRTALGVFGQAAPSLVDLRNIAEHLDEYSVGRGRIDEGELEPGDVFEMTITDEDVVVEARGRRLGVLSLRAACTELTACLASAFHHQMIWAVMPPFADFDFFVDTDDGPRRVPRDEETPDQKAFRAAISGFASSRDAAMLDSETRCEHCGEVL